MISDNWARGRTTALPRLLPPRLRSPQTVVLVLILALLGWIGWAWYRSSSFVKVEHVTVTGLAGPNVPQIRRALTRSALRMTTLHMQISQLQTAVEQYPYISSLQVTSHGAHTVVIHVEEQVPVALVEIGGTAELIDADGRLLRGTTVTHGPLPTVALKTPPEGGSLTAAGPRAVIAVLAAAPYSLLPHIANATSTSAHGVVLQLRRGPQLYFGTATQLRQKWNATVGVLQDHDSAGASYIDVTDPRLPAAGAGVSQKQAIDLGLAEAADTTTTTATTGDEPAVSGP